MFRLAIRARLRPVQRVLDIDLDFFLDRILYADDEPRGRPSNQDFQVDAPQVAFDFLRTQCGLDESKPIPGAACKHHREVWFHWRRLLKRGELKAPFEVIHVDAHADMGLGNNSCLYIAEELLAHPVAKRRPPTGRENWHVSDCNFIAYALAQRWIGRLTYVTHPQWQDDIQWLHMKDFSTTSGFVQMKQFEAGFAEELEDFMDVKQLPFKAEPEIPLNVVPRAKFKLDTPPDHVFLSRSPNYTPRTADQLFDVLSRFIAPCIGEHPR